MSTQPQQNETPVARNKETRSQAVARRLRGKLAEMQITQVELAARLNTNQQYLSRRLTGAVAFDLDQIDGIAEVTGIPVEYLLLGIKAEDPPVGGGSNVSLLGESNSRQFHYNSRGSDPKDFLERLGGCQVHLFPAPAGEDAGDGENDAEIIQFPYHRLQEAS